MQTPNPERYEELSRPFEKLENAQIAVVNFIEAVGDLRVEHGIANVSVSAQVFVTGEAQVAANHAHFGDSRMAVPMASSILKARRAEIVRALASIDETIADAMGATNGL